METFAANVMGLFSTKVPGNTLIVSPGNASAACCLYCSLCITFHQTSICITSQIRNINCFPIEVLIPTWTVPFPSNWEDVKVIPVPTVSCVTIPTKLSPLPEKKDPVTIPAEFNSLTVVTPRVVIPDALKLVTLVTPRVVIPEALKFVTEAIPPITFIAVVAVDAWESPVIVIL